MDDYFALQPNHAHDNFPTPIMDDEYVYRSPLDSPEAFESSKTQGPSSTERGEATMKPVEGARTKTVLSPSELVSVLDQERDPPPPPQARFLHGGPPLSDLLAPSEVIAGASVASKGSESKPVASSKWRAFTDAEDEMLQEGWKTLQAEKKKEKEEGRMSEDKKKAKKETDQAVKDSAEDPAEMPHCYPVGLDKLFTVSLASSILYPAFWQGTPVRVLRAHWFYPPPVSKSKKHKVLPSHQVKAYPVDPALAASLDAAYANIRPWEESYTAELASALKGGVEAQLRLSVPLGVGNESGADANSGIEVIFQGGDEGRVYSKSFLGSIGKSLWSTGKGLGGGQVVLRGWDTVMTYHVRKEKAAAALKAATAPATTSTPKKGNDSAIDSSDNESISSRAEPRSRHGSTSSTTKPNPAVSEAGSGFFATLKSKLGGMPLISQPHDSEDESDAASKGERANDTQEAMDGPRNGAGDIMGKGEVGEVDEIVLVCHGIGQKLAGKYESFSFVHAVNHFRTSCTNLSTSESLAPLLHNKRAQFIPLLWRTDLTFEDDLDDSGDSADEHLRNSFGLDDIEIKGSIPLLRQVVSGLVLDVPFYLSHHKTKMLRAVVKEANRIYRLFCQRNPGFAERGKVSIIGHSLGSALCADVLSSQPTFVKPIKEMSKEEKFSDTQFIFDTRLFILVGSPLAFFLQLGRGQLIARRGRARAKDVARDIALDRAGRYGCMAIDAVYNVYHETDPVAFALNPTVDREYAKLIKPIAIPSTNRTLLENLTDTYSRISNVLDVSRFWSSTPEKGADSNGKEDQVKRAAGEDAKRKEEEEKNKRKDVMSKPRLPIRRPTNKRMPSEMPMGTKQFENVSRAEQRFKALNPQGCVDFFIPAEGFNQYIDALSSHAGYWSSETVATFVLTQLFASEEDLVKTGREEIGTDIAEEADEQ